MAEVEKHNDDWMIEQTDKAINELVYEKVDLIKAYNYYAGVRDKKQFQHLETNYGIGSPTSVQFTPLVRPHIDVLVGEFLTLPQKPKTSCKDQTTISNIQREKQLEVAKRQMEIVKQKMQHSIYSMLRGDGKHKINDIQFEQELHNVEDYVDQNFVSSYEQASQNIITWILQSRDIDMQTKLQWLITDYYVAGQQYYRVEPTIGGNQISLQVLNPINSFPDMNVNSPYVNDAYRFVYREYLSKTELMMKYGKDMSKSDIDSLESNKFDYANNRMMLVYNNQRICTVDVDDSSQDFLSGYGYTPMYNSSPSQRIDLYCVYDVEWIDYEFNENKERIEHRYHSVRIGQDIYILYPKDQNVTRSVSSPNECKLSVNGLQNLNRTGKPLSLVLDTMDLQDKYDICNFYKDCVVSNSGINGDWIDVSMLPSFLGTEPQEKLAKWLAYKKNGIALIDTTQEGVQPMNTIFNGYDDTLKYQTMQAIDLVIQDIQNKLTNITGVTPQRLGNIAQRDAVANVEAGMQQSFIITKKYFSAMDQILRDVLLDCLNLAKTVYKDGICGTLILGDCQKQIFTAIPESFTVTDFDIHILNSQEAIKEKEQIKQIGMELVKGGQVDPRTLLDIVTSENISQMKFQMNKSMKEQEEKANQVNQLSQQLQQAQQQLKEMEQQLKQATAKAQKFDQMQYQLEEKKIMLDSQMRKQELEFKQNVEDKKLEIEKQKAQIEYAQLYDNNPNNDKVKYNYNA